MADPRSGRLYRQYRAQVIAAEAHCWLCGELVDKTLHHNHPLAATADHVTPLNKGGHPLGPMRLAHRSCNSARKDGPAPEHPPGRLRKSRKW